MINTLSTRLISINPLNASHRVRAPSLRLRPPHLRNLQLPITSRLMMASPVHRTAQDAATRRRRGRRKEITRFHPLHSLSAKGRVDYEGHEVPFTERMSQSRREEDGSRECAAYVINFFIIRKDVNLRRTCRKKNTEGCNVHPSTNPISPSNPSAVAIRRTISVEEIPKLNVRNRVLTSTIQR